MNQNFRPTLVAHHGIGTKVRTITNQIPVPLTRSARSQTETGTKKDFGTRINRGRGAAYVGALFTNAQPTA
jgi:hypothetical protein